MHQEQKNQGVEAGGINPNAKTGETTVTLTPVQREIAEHIEHYGYAALRTKAVPSAIVTARSMYAKGYSYTACGLWVVIARTLDAARKGYLAMTCSDAVKSLRLNKTLMPPAPAVEIATPVILCDAEIKAAPVPVASIYIQQVGRGKRPACNVCEDGYKAIHNGICTNAACPFSVVGGNR